VIFTFVPPLMGTPMQGPATTAHPFSPKPFASRLLERPKRRKLPLSMVGVTVVALVAVLMLVAVAAGVVAKGQQQKRKKWQLRRLQMKTMTTEEEVL